MTFHSQIIENGTLSSLKSPSAIAPYISSESLLCFLTPFLLPVCDAFQPFQNEKYYFLYLFILSNPSFSIPDL
jgi:hypothetical protein